MRKNEGASLVSSIMSSGANRPAKPAGKRTQAADKDQESRPSSRARTTSRAKPGPKGKAASTKPRSTKSKAATPAKTPKSKGQRSYRFCVSIRATTMAALRAHIVDTRIESGRRVPMGEVVAEALDSANLTAPSLDNLAPGRGGNRVTVSFYMPKEPARALYEAVDRRKMDRRAVRNISDVVDVALAAMLGA